MLTFMAGCLGVDKNTARLKGRFKHLQQAQIFIYSDAPAFGRLDTINVIGGSFDYRTPLSEPTVLTIMYPNFSETILVAEPGVVLTLEADANNLRDTKVSGSAANDSLSAFRKRHSSETPEIQRKAAEAYISKHPADMASVALFIKYFVQSETLYAEPTTTLLRLLTKAMPDHTGLRTIGNHLRPLLRTAVGAKAPAELTKKPLPAVITFTLATQYQSGEMMRQIDRAVTERDSLKPKPKHISVDEIKVDDCDLDSLRQAYGLRYVPGNILIDSRGRITARDLPINKLVDAVKRAS